MPIKKSGLQPGYQVPSSEVEKNNWPIWLGLGICGLTTFGVFQIKNAQNQELIAAKEQQSLLRGAVDVDYTLPKPVSSRPEGSDIWKNRICNLGYQEPNETAIEACLVPGVTLKEVQLVFGPGDPYRAEANVEEYKWNNGRGRLIVTFVDRRLSQRYYENLPVEPSVK